ncbi:MAG TPA: hypothetical protein VJ044_18220, partial [Candidatus Hodarchaeales archaeon]|nr:hypothetical protein [Candidatus Hodarchaeales archaeon]
QMATFFTETHIGIDYDCLQLLLHLFRFRPSLALTEFSTARFLRFPFFRSNFISYHEILVKFAGTLRPEILDFVFGVQDLCQMIGSKRYWKA